MLHKISWKAVFQHLSATQNKNKQTNNNNNNNKDYQPLVAGGRWQICTTGHLPDLLVGSRESVRVPDRLVHNGGGAANEKSVNVSHECSYPSSLKPCAAAWETSETPALLPSIENTWSRIYLWTWHVIQCHRELWLFRTYHNYGNSQRWFTCHFLVKSFIIKILYGSHRI